MAEAILWGHCVTALDTVPAHPVLGGPRHCHLAAPQSSLTGGCGPFPEQPCPPPASWAKEVKVSSLLSVRWPNAGPGPGLSPPAGAAPASADSLRSAEAFGHTPAGCVTNQPQRRQSALGKRNVWCALVFSSNCFMARSAGKIFQNKAIDGNYISTLGTDGMWTLSALCKKHPSIRQTHVIAACWGWAGAGRGQPRHPFRTEGTRGDVCSG